MEVTNGDAVVPLEADPALVDETSPIDDVDRTSEIDDKISEALRMIAESKEKLDYLTSLSAELKLRNQIVKLQSEIRKCRAQLEPDEAQIQIKQADLDSVRKRLLVSDDKNDVRFQ